MPLLLSLGRESTQAELGAHDELLLAGDKICAVTDGRVLAYHTHYRWHTGPDEKDSYSRVDIVGPLVLRGSEAGVSPDASKVLGPYAHYSFVDGVAYVDRRVFGFWDLVHRDWYLTDLGEHWKTLTICFYRRGQ